MTRPQLTPTDSVRQAASTALKELATEAARLAELLDAEQRMPPFALARLAVLADRHHSQLRRAGEKLEA